MLGKGVAERKGNPAVCNNIDSVGGFGRKYCTVSPVATTAVKFTGAEQSRAWQGLRGRETRK